jgi:hypothetical protein
VPESAPGWKRHFVYGAERTRTTWKLRLAVLAFAAATLWLTVGWWTAALGRSLVCDANGEPSDAILIENFDTDYLLFERARDLRRAGLAGRVIIPALADPHTSQPNEVAVGFIEVMAKLSRLGSYDVVPTRHVEPISLNVARDVLEYLQQERIRSVIIVSPLFRSRRSALVFVATLGRAGIGVSCEPDRSTLDVDTWPLSWHGIQNVTEQWIKLQYYRFYILPFRLR